MQERRFHILHGHRRRKDGALAPLREDIRRRRVRRAIFYIREKTRVSCKSKTRVLITEFIFWFIFIAKGYVNELFDCSYYASCNRLDGASPLQASPHKGRTPCESPGRALRSQDSATCDYDNSNDFFSRDKGYSNLNFSPFLRVWVFVVYTLNSVTWAKV